MDPAFRGPLPKTWSGAGGNMGSGGPVAGR